MLRKPWFCIIDEPGPRKPWFRILDVTDIHGRSMADIVVEVAQRRNLPLTDIRGGRQTRALVDARRDALEQIRRERPDLTSGTVAAFLRCESSTVRHHWRKMAGEMHS